MRKQILTLLLLATSLGANAQVLRGTVTDAVTSEPLPYATVMLKELPKRAVCRSVHSVWKPILKGRKCRTMIPNFFVFCEGDTGHKVEASQQEFIVLKMIYPDTA